MRKTDLVDLMKAVESIRSQIHPELDRRFLESVIEAEEANPEDDEGAMRAIQGALNAALSKSEGA